MNFLFDDEVKDIKFKEVWKNYSHALSELKAGDSAIIRMKELAENAMYQGVSRTDVYLSWIPVIIRMTAA